MKQKFPNLSIRDVQSCLGGIALQLYIQGQKHIPTDTAKNPRVTNMWNSSSDDSAAAKRGARRQLARESQTTSSTGTVVTAAVRSHGFRGARREDGGGNVQQQRFLRKQGSCSTADAEDSVCGAVAGGAGGDGTGGGGDRETIPFRWVTPRRETRPADTHSTDSRQFSLSGSSLRPPPADGGRWRSGAAAAVARAPAGGAAAAAEGAGAAAAAALAPAAPSFGQAGDALVLSETQARQQRQSEQQLWQQRQREPGGETKRYVPPPLHCVHTC